MLWCCRWGSSLPPSTTSSTTSTATSATTVTRSPMIMNLTPEAGSLLKQSRWEKTVIRNTAIGYRNLNQGMFISAARLLGLEFQNLDVGVVDAVLKLRRRSKLRKPTSTSMETTEEPRRWGVQVFCDSSGGEGNRGRTMREAE